jgi:palmitoyl transferase
MPISILHCPGWRWVTRVACSVIGIASVPVSGRAGPLDFGGLFAGKREAVHDAIRFGEWETYFTGYAWHLPHGYQEKTRARLNETTWGGGFGRTINDEDGDRHSVYVMAFADSHREPQLNFGYAWQRYWAATRNLSLGGGYLAFVFSRADVANHLPIPALLPCASIRYRGVEVIGLFVPRVSRDIKGDVLFVYLRLSLGRGTDSVKQGTTSRRRGRR